jgi:hypothetical protein
MWSVLRIFLGERDEADFASDCTVWRAVLVLRWTGILSKAHHTGLELKSQCKVALVLRSIRRHERRFGRLTYRRPL